MSGFLKEMMSIGIAGCCVLVSRATPQNFQVSLCSNEFPISRFFIPRTTIRSQKLICCRCPFWWNVQSMNGRRHGLCSARDVRKIKVTSSSDGCFVPPRRFNVLFCNRHHDFSLHFAVDHRWKTTTCSCCNSCGQHHRGGISPSPSGPIDRIFGIKQRLFPSCLVLPCDRLLHWWLETRKWLTDLRTFSSRNQSINRLRCTDFPPDYRSRCVFAVVGHACWFSLVRPLMGRNRDKVWMDRVAGARFNVWKTLKTCGLVTAFVHHHRSQPRRTTGPDYRLCHRPVQQRQKKWKCRYILRTKSTKGCIPSRVNVANCAIVEPVTVTSRFDCRAIERRSFPKKLLLGFKTPFNAQSRHS